MVERIASIPIDVFNAPIDYCVAEQLTCGDRSNIWPYVDDVTRLTSQLSITAADPNWQSGIDGELPSSFSHHTIDGLPIGMECSPGCAISWEEYGLKVSDIGEFYGKSVQLPDKCAAGSKGCGPVDSNIKPTCKPENIANSMCTRLRFNDVPYSDQIVGVRDVE